MRNTEPMLIFALLCALIFAWDALRADTGHRESRQQIVVTAFTQQALEAEFTWLQGRKPSDTEQQTLLADWVEEELLFQEALNTGLHETDTKMRHRLIDIVRSLWASTAPEADAAVLLDYYLENIADYYSPPSFTFEQVYFATPPDDPAAILQALERGVTVTGDDFWLGSRLIDYSESLLRQNFSGAFYEQLVALTGGGWSGPLESPRGAHFVRVIERLQPAPRAFAQVQQQVADDWLAEQQQRLISERVSALAGDYQIIYE